MVPFSRASWHFAMFLWLGKDSHENAPVPVSSVGVEWQGGSAIATSPLGGLGGVPECGFLLARRLMIPCQKQWKCCNWVEGCSIVFHLCDSLQWFYMGGEWIKLHIYSDKVTIFPSCIDGIRRTFVSVCLISTKVSCGCLSWVTEYTQTIDSIPRLPSWSGQSGL